MGVDQYNYVHFVDLVLFQRQIKLNGTVGLVFSA